VPEDAPSEKPVVVFDHHAPGFDPETAWRELRETSPVAWSESYGGFWIVSDWAGNHEVLKNHEVFTTERLPYGGEGTSLTIPKIPDPFRSMPEEVDPPTHGPLRRLLNIVMSPAASAALQPRIEHWVGEHLDAVLESGECDLLYDVASPVPAHVTLEWLGVPLEHAKLASDAFHEMLGYPPGTEKFERALMGRMRVSALVEEIVPARRAAPQDDIISWFTKQEIDGQPLDDRLIMEMCMTLIGGGVDSTTSLTSNALVHLHHDHALRQRLIDEPDLLGPVTEEFLRFYPPFGCIGRMARQPAELRGCPVAVGDHVMVSRYAANYDGAAFEDPESFIPDRFPNRHVSFGLGVHRCSGSHLARLMFQEMLRQILATMPDYELDDDVLERYPDRGFVQGWVALPARFSPSGRARPSAG
jgi:cytochrome P450